MPARSPKVKTYRVLPAPSGQGPAAKPPATLPVQEGRRRRPAGSGAPLPFRGPPGSWVEPQDEHDPEDLAESIYVGGPAPDEDPDPAEPEGSGRPSRTRRKTDALAAQRLGEALLELPLARLKALDLPERAFDAIVMAQKTKSFEGRRRQLQYVGKIMRGLDLDPLEEAVAAHQLGRARETLALHRAERWRTELLASDEAFDRWAAEHPASDLHRLRALVRKARQEAEDRPDTTRAGTAPRQGRSYRELFNWLRDRLASAVNAAAAGRPAGAAVRPQAAEDEGQDEPAD
ncbi:ribosome biogenesis factor YjgA [Aquariibacter albus]|uniref:ribosome biogenesis factor YjgA n=1 Tax=Aquariibacter albus TaxID=2759899 RepID=UPI002E2E7E71|nr:ribosome biogenesis factor YjgA [Aquariibacter albus]